MHHQPIKSKRYDNITLKDNTMASRVRKNMINTIKMLPHNESTIRLLKEMLISYINKDKSYSTKPELTGIEKRFQQDMINEMDSQY